MIPGLVLLGALTSSHAVQETVPNGGVGDVKYAVGVLERTVGRQAKNFSLELTPKRDDGLDAFTVSASDGTVHVHATSPVALCRGAYEYLKSACHCQVNWSESNTRLPAKLLDFAPLSVVCPNRFRHYFNICTFGYSAVWWDWKRWQHEIDWMALHGINMPLSLNGQEKIWQRVFRSYKISEPSILNFFSGPAFLPWHWMGNLNAHGGPLPQTWIDGQVDLEKKILAQERGLGMTPIVSGFSGFVPVDFDKVHPEVKLSSPTAWAGFEPTKFVDVRNPIFVEIGKRYIDEYRKEFGSDHYYLCDTFNEQNPQFPPETELSDLSACGRSVYDSIRQADPSGTWVMQGWLFYNERDYWTIPRVDALTRDVPKGKMIVLDLATNESAVWKRLPAVREGGWIYNTLHNYGQNTGLYGSLQELADRASSDLNDPNHGRMLGMGLTMEGIDQNPVVYELMTDAMWRSERIDVSRWIREYVASRYGIESAEAEVAWQILLETVYGKDLRWSKASWRGRPDLSRVAPSSYDPKRLRQAIAILLDVRQKVQSNPLLDRDLVDLTKTWLGAIADANLAAAIATFDDDRVGYAKYRDKFFATLHDIDRAMAIMPEHRLSSWLSDSRRWGRTAAEKDRVEWNARMQVTIWGGPELFDYANKEWAGLNDDFLSQRWRLFFSALETVAHSSKLVLPDFAKWEKGWTESKVPPKESRPEPILKLVGEFLAKYPESSGDVASLLGVSDDPGIAVGAKVWDSGHTEGDHRPELAVDGHLDGGYWAASPAPQWLEIDLGKVQPVGGVWLFPYYGDGRVYRYKIEGSVDDRTWQTMADGSENVLPATFRGYRRLWTPTSQRFIRIVMLQNSANVGVHLYEVRVFGDKVAK